jgi:ABC-type uncharacterized transport system substrate-binding protein
MVVHRAKISLVMQHKVPAISDRTLPTERGGLVSYGPALEELFLGAALYADRILCGANPAELPVQGERHKPSYRRVTPLDARTFTYVQLCRGSQSS